MVGELGQVALPEFGSHEGGSGMTDACDRVLLVQIPQSTLATATRRGQIVAVWMELDEPDIGAGWRDGAGHKAGMTAIGEVPQPHRTVISAGGHGLAVGTERGRDDRQIM